MKTLCLLLLSLSAAEPRVILDAPATAKLPAADVEKIASANARQLFSL